MKAGWRENENRGFGGVRSFRVRRAVLPPVFNGTQGGCADGQPGGLGLQGLACLRGDGVGFAVHRMVADVGCLDGPEGARANMEGEVVEAMIPIFQFLNQLGREMEACRGCGHRPAFSWVGIDCFIPDGIHRRSGIIRLAGDVGWQRGQPDIGGQGLYRGMCAGMKRHEADPVVADLQHFSRTTARKNEPCAHPQMASGSTEAPPLVDFRTGPEEEAFNRTACRTHPPKACTKDGNVVSEDCRGAGEQLGQVAHSQMLDRA